MADPKKIGIFTLVTINLAALGGIRSWAPIAECGFLAAWLLWIENVMRYPTILLFIGGTISYALNPDLASNPIYNVVLMLTIFWTTTLINL